MGNPVSGGGVFSIRSTENDVHVNVSSDANTGVKPSHVYVKKVLECNGSGVSQVRFTLNRFSSVIH